LKLRQYALVPGARETLIELFEREFIETQEATGMTVIGQFRDVNNPDRFVWLRVLAIWTRGLAATGVFTVDQFGKPIAMRPTPQ